MDFTSSGLPKITQRTLNKVLNEITDPTTQDVVAELWCREMNGHVLKAYLVAATEEMPDEQRNLTRTFMAGVYRLLDERVREGASEGDLYLLPVVQKPAFEKVWGEIRAGPITDVMNEWLDAIYEEDRWMSAYMNFTAHSVPGEMSEAILARMVAVYRMIEAQSEERMSELN